MKAPLRDRLRYRSDRIMSAGAKAQIAGLAVLSGIVVAVVFGVIVLLNVRTGFSRPTVLFHAFLESIDPGTVANFSSASCSTRCSPCWSPSGASWWWAP